MADAIIADSNKPCIKCGSLVRNTNGDCRPCQILCSKNWKIKEKARLEQSGEPLFYTYIHKRKSDGRVFYVGKGTGYRASLSADRSKHWKNVVDKHGLEIEIVQKWHLEDDALNHEIALIAHYKSIGQAECNYTHGGDGISGHKHSEETKARISAIQIGKKLSDEHKAKVGAAGKGRRHSEETKLKISLSNSGKKRTAEQNKKNSERNTGKTITDAHLQALVNSRKGKLHTQETKNKISQTKRRNLEIQQAR
jgi:hypothetical protein